MKKKILSIILIIMMLFGTMFALTGCGKSDTKSQKSNEEENEKIVKNIDMKQDEEYKEVVKKFFDACESEDKMMEFFNDYVDLKAICAWLKSSQKNDGIGSDRQEIFDREYSTIKESDDDYKTLLGYIPDQYTAWVKDLDDVKIKEISELEDSTIFKYDDVKETVVTIEENGDELEFLIVFYKDKVIYVSLNVLMEALEESTSDISIIKKFYKGLISLDDDRFLKYYDLSYSYSEEEIEILEDVFFDICRNVSGHSNTKVTVYKLDSVDDCKKTSMSDELTQGYNTIKKSAEKDWEIYGVIVETTKDNETTETPEVCAMKNGKIVDSCVAKSYFSTILSDMK